MSTNPDNYNSQCYCRCLVYRLKEARKRNIEQLRTLHSKPGTLPPRDDDDDDDSGISSHGNGTGSISSPEFSDPLTSSLSSASLKNPAYVKARILSDFTSTRVGTELSVSKGDVVHMLYREGDQVLVVNSSGKRGFIPLRYCALLQKKIQSVHTPESKNHMEYYHDWNLSNFQNSYTTTSRTNRHHSVDSSLERKTLQPSTISSSRTHLASTDHITSKNYRQMNSTQSLMNPHFGNKTNAKISLYRGQRTNTSSSSEEDSDYSFRGDSEYPDLWGSRNVLDSNRNYVKNGYVLNNSRNPRVTENYVGKSTHVMDVKHRYVADKAQSRYTAGTKNDYVYVAKNVKDSYVENRYVTDKFRHRQKNGASIFRKSEESKMMVMYDFIARDENDISVYKGETIVVLNRDDDEWWWIATTEGYEGFVPSRYLSRGSSDGKLLSIALSACLVL